MQTTHHIPMRTRRITVGPGCIIQTARPGRATDRRRAIADSLGLR